MDGSDDGAGSSAGPRSKVARLIEEYGLDGLGERLERDWTGEGDEQRSLRDLADYFNQRLLRAALEDAGRTPLAGEVANTYRLLQDDDASSGKRVQARNTLARRGVAVEDLEADFVSHQAMHTYLTNYRDVEREASTDAERVAKGAETIQRLKSRLATVARTTLASLRDTDRVALGEFDVLVDVQVFCRECGARYEVGKLLEGGGCDCDADS